MKSLEAIVADNAAAVAAALHDGKDRSDLAIRQTGVFDFGDGRGPVPVHRHPNGGGLVADTAYVAPTAYVGPLAWVFGEAAVMDEAMIFDQGRVCDRAQVRDKARVFKYGVVRDGALIRDLAEICGEVCGLAEIGGTVRVLPGVRVSGANLFDEGQVINGEV